MGRYQIHRIHGFPPWGWSPRPVLMACPAMQRSRPTLSAACCSSCSEACTSSRLAPGWAQRVNSINKQQMEKYISQENGEVQNSKSSGRHRLLSPSAPLSSRSILMFPFFGSAVPCDALWPEERGQSRAHQGPHPLPVTTCARGPQPWRPPRWWLCAPQAPGQPWRSPRPLWALSQWCCPRGTPGPRSAGRGPGPAG